MNIDTLINKYLVNSKHSDYQVLPIKLEELLKVKLTPTKPRYERERMSFILNNVELTNKSVLDIGGNTGFFTFESIYNGAMCADYYEGNKEHSGFVKEICQYFKYPVKVYGDYFEFESQPSKKYDVTYLLNVLHHIGDDFHSSNITQEDALLLIIKYLNSMNTYSRHLIFQLGYNQHGNISKPLFPGGTKQEMIDFISDGIQDTWEIIAIGIPIRRDEQIIYVEPTPDNLKRDDSLGEFLNRPLFVLKSKLPN